MCESQRGRQEATVVVWLGQTLINWCVKHNDIIWLWLGFVQQIVEAYSLQCFYFLIYVQVCFDAFRLQLSVLADSLNNSKDKKKNLSHISQLTDFSEPVRTHLKRRTKY